MSTLELRPFEKQLSNPIYARRLEQTEKKTAENKEKQTSLKNSLKQHTIRNIKTIEHTTRKNRKVQIDSPIYQTSTKKIGV